MLSVLKYPVPFGDYFSLMLPKNAQVLKIEMQKENLNLWALVDREQLPIKRNFRSTGTGHPIEESKDNLNFISTFQMYGGDLVFHIFEIVD